MNKTYIDENIYVIKNFIVQEDLDVILKDLKDAEGWRESGSFYQKSEDVYSEETKNLLSDKYRLIVEELINDDNNMANWQNMLQKFVVKDGLPWAINPHSDQFDYKQKGAGESTSKYVTKGYIIYFNDDFSGGEVVYTNKNITLKPEAGMLLVHPGTQEYEHGVKAVTSGERYILTGFVYEKDFFEKEMIGER